VFGEAARNVLLKYVSETEVANNTDAKRYVDMLREWDGYANPNSTATTVFQAWYDSLEVSIWKDEWTKDSLTIGLPDEQTLLEWINRDSAFRFIDNINTTEKETIQLLVTQALLKATPVLKEKETAGKLEWTKHKDPTIYHLLRDALLPFARKVPVGGWSNVINATTHSHGPSWRMIVHLSGQTEAYGVYPGGQSGNPGSRFYDNFVDVWSAGDYYPLWMMKASEAKDERIKWKMTFTKSA
jgi:penicillin G amidase